MLKTILVEGGKFLAEAALSKILSSSKGGIPPLSTPPLIPPGQDCPGAEENSATIIDSVVNVIREAVE